MGAYVYIGHIRGGMITRWIIWGPVIERIFTRPTEGHGIGSFPMIADQIIPVTDRVADTAFSSGLQFLLEFGLLFGLTWLIYFVWHYRKEFKRPNALGLITIGILSITEYPIQVERLWITITAIVGFFVININQKKGGEVL